MDKVFHALGDATRRAVLKKLSTGSTAVSELAKPFDMALPSFLQHLKVLEDSGLVNSQKAGRVRTYRLSPRPLALAEKWLEEQRSVWEKRLDRLDSYLNEMKEKKL